MRDRQLQAAASWAAAQTLPAIVAGDLNTTPGSWIWPRLVEPAGLLDSRRGQGAQASWPAPLPRIMRIPIDHLRVEQMPATTVLYEVVERLPSQIRYAMLAPQPLDMTCGELHGLISCSDWTGVPLSILLDEAGLQPQARWVVADGADAAILARSVPLEKILDDAIVALYQNGEPLRPANGFPMRLFLPGWEGNASVKWLRSAVGTRAK